MGKSRKEYVTEYCDKIRSGHLEYSNFRKELQLRIMDSEDIEIIMKRVDRDLSHMAAADITRSKGKQMFYGGLAIMACGILGTTTTYLGILDLGDQFILAYGPALGLGMAVVGMHKMSS